MLKENGYYTALIGKWHLGHREENLPNAQGFDYFFGHQRGCIDNYSHTFYWDGPNKHDLYRDAEEVYYPGQHFSDLMVDEVKKLITTKKVAPFLYTGRLMLPIILIRVPLSGWITIGICPLLEESTPHLSLIPTKPLVMCSLNLIRQVCLRILSLFSNPIMDILSRNVLSGWRKCWPLPGK